MCNGASPLARSQPTQFNDHRKIENENGDRKWGPKMGTENGARGGGEGLEAGRILLGLWKAHRIATIYRR